MSQQKTVIVGHYSGNSGNSGNSGISGNSRNSNTCMTMEEESAGHQISPMSGSITYTNVEIHIGLFGGQIKLPDHKRVHISHPCRRIMACITASALCAVLATSTPTQCRHEQHLYSTECAEQSETKSPMMLTCTCGMKIRRKRI